MDPYSLDDENYINSIMEESFPMALPLRGEAGKVLMLLKEGLYNSEWNQAINNYKLLENEPCFQENMLLRGNKIAIPSKLRTRVLSAAHEEHPGIMAMKSRLRTKGGDRKSTKMVKIT